MSDIKKTNKTSVPNVIRLLLSAIIPIIVIVISFYIGGFEPFGNKNVITSSKTPEELFKYYEMYDHFKNNLTDNFSNTLGTIHEYYSDHLVYLSDPTNLIILLVSKESIPTVINLLYILKISLCSLFFNIYLTGKKNDLALLSQDNIKKKKVSENKKKKSIVLGGNDNPDTRLKSFLLDLNPISIAFSVSFALSGYFLSEGYNINYLLSIAMLPLIALGIDKLIYERKTLLLIISLSVSIISNVYISIISLMLITVYFFIELSQKKDSRFYLSIRFFSSAIISIFLTSVIWFPVITGNTFKNTISLSFVRYEKINNIWNVCSQFMFKVSPSSLSWFDCGVNLYMGILGILIAASFFINNRFKALYRLEYGIFIILLFLSLLISNINYLFNGFRGFINNTYIYGYFIVFLVLTLAYCSFSSINSINKVLFTIIAILISVIIILTMKKAESLVSIKPLFYSLEILFAYYLIILIRIDKSMTKTLFNLLISAICIFEIAATYIPNCSAIGTNAFNRPTIDSTEYKQYEACKYIHDVDPDATILAYESTPYDTTPFNMAIEGFDYVIIRENYTMVDPVLEYVTTIKEKGMIIGMSIYKNPDAIHSVFSQKDIDSYIYDSEHPFISANIFTNGYMNTKDIFDITDGTVSSDRSYNDRSETFHYSVYSPGEAYAKTYKTEYIGDNSSRKEYDTIQSIPVNRFNSYTTEFAVLNQDGYNSFINVCKKSNENTRISPNKSGNIQALDAGSMIIPVQNSSNLKIFNNSKKSKFRSVLQGCILLGIDKGDNKISINYSFIYFIIGFIISALSFILFILKNKYLQKSKMKSFIKKTNCFIKSNYVYIVTFLILTITFISAQIITGTIPFGRKPTIRDDAISQSFAYYVEKVRLVKNGMPFSWISNNIGMSRDITLSSLTSIPIHPWNYIKYRFLPESMYLFDFTLEFFTIYMLNALSIIFYLTHRKFNSINKKEKKLILLGTVYGLSTYAIVLFQYECFLFLLFTPLIILGMEKIIYENKKALYIAALAYIMLNDAYYAFLLCEWIVIIFLTYNFDNIKHFFKSVLRLGIASLGSAGIAAFRLLPYYFMTRTSGYKGNDTVSIPSIFDSFTDAVTLLSDYRPLNYMRTMSDSDYKSATYISMITLIVVPLYMISKSIRLSKRIKNLLLVLLLVISFNNKLLNYVFHGMHYQTLVPNRFAAVLVFILVCMTADVLLNYKNYKSTHLLITATVITVIYTVIHIAYRDINILSSKLGLVLLILISIIQIANALAEEKQKDIKNICYKLMCILMIIDVLSNSLFLFNYNIGSQNKILTQASYINNLTSHFEDITKPFTGSVYLNNTNQNIACMTDIQSPEFFYSGASSETLDFYNKYNIHNSLNTSYYGTGNPLADMMMHTKYHIEDTYQDAHITWYPLVKSVNNMNVYENPYSLPLGFVISEETSSDLSNWDKVYEPTAEYKNVFEYQNAFAQAYGTEKLYDSIKIKEVNIFYRHLSLFEMYNMDKLLVISDRNDIEKPWRTYYCINKIKSSFSSQKSSYYIPVTVHINTTDLTPGTYYTCMNDYILYLCDITEEDVKNSVSLDLNIDIPSDTKPKISKLRDSFSIAKLNKDVLNSIHNTLSQSTLSDISTNGQRINAKLNAYENGKLYIGLPYSANWKLYIDNKETALNQYIGGMGADVTNGNHSIVLKYHPPGLFTGIAISIISIISAILLYILANKKLKKKQ
ncbi:MAG: YfhO family protein [Eubacterium sp.]|nr:YfhO family protein [Eubacterium sp.]